MPASVRGSYATGFQAPSRTIPRPSGVQPGDLLVLVHSASTANVDALQVTSTGWVEVTQASAGSASTAVSTKVYRRVVAADEPSSYRVVQPSTARTTVMIIVVRGGGAAGLRAIVQSGIAGVDNAVVTPSGVPATGSGVDIRVAVGYRSYSATPSWRYPAGYSYLDEADSGSRLMVTAAHRAIVSTGVLGEAVFRQTSGINTYIGITLLVPATDSAPTAPDVAPWAPGRGLGIYRYTVHDLLTGAYLSDVQLTNVTFDRRINEPGTFSATIPVPNATVARQVAQIIPRHADDLGAGPGRITIRIWRASELWGEYWITGAIIQRTRRGGIEIQLRGSTLDAFPANVLVETSVTYTGDVINNIRSFLGHMQGLPGANLRLELEPGTVGQTATLEAKLEEDPTYGGVLTGYLSDNRVEMFVDPRFNEVTGEVERIIRWGSPRLASDTVHVVTESPHGGDILEWSEEIDALRGATRIRVRGGTPEVEDAEEGAEPLYSNWVSATSHLSAGWPRYGQVVDHPAESTNLATLNSYATRWISTMPGAVRVYSCTVALGRHTTITPSALGDRIRRILVNEWFPREDGGATFNSEQRLIGIEITPVSRETGREEARLILEEPTVSDLGGDRYPTEQRRHIWEMRKRMHRLGWRARRVPPIPMLWGPDPGDPPVLESTTISGNPTAGHFNGLLSDVSRMRSTLQSLIVNLRNGRLVR